MNLKAVTADANSDNVFVSESAGSCERDQQSTVQQPDGKANYTFTPYCKYFISLKFNKYCYFIPKLTNVISILFFQLHAVSTNQCFYTLNFFYF